MSDNYNTENDSFGNNLDSENNARTLKQPSFWKVILLLLALFVLGSFLSSFLAVIAGEISGINWEILLNRTKIENIISNRSFLRFYLFWMHVLSFIVPAIITLQYFYKKDWLAALGLTKFPNWKLVGLSILFLLASIPVVQYSAEINKMIPLPALLKGWENSTDDMLKVILTKDYFYEIIVNVILIGIIPAIGEELVFRGILQQQFGRWIKNPHVMVWLTAFIFSAIHFQFEGFLPRAILGAVLGYLFYWTKTILIPMMVHLIFNASQVIAIYAYNVKPDDIGKIGEDTKIHWALAIASITIMFVIARLIINEKNNLVEKVDDTNLKT